MEVSIVIDGQCQFTKKREKYLVGLSDTNGQKVILSRECIQMGLKLLNAMEDTIVPTIQEIAQKVHHEPLPKTPIVTYEEPKQFPKPILAASGIRNVLKPQSIDMNKVQMFVKAIQKAHKKDLEDNDKEKDDGNVSNYVIKQCINQYRNQIDKQTMFQALKSCFKQINKDLFEVAYAQSNIIEMDDDDDN